MEIGCGGGREKGTGIFDVEIDAWGTKTLVARAGGRAGGNAE